MSPEILTIVPTKNRNLQEFCDSFFANTKYSKLVFAVDENNYHLKNDLPNIHYEIVPNKNKIGAVYPLNYVARKYYKSYTHLVFMADDNRIRTKHWDSYLYNKIKDIRYGIAYPNDLLQGENLPTVVMLDSLIVKILGYMVPDIILHQYCDNFWKELGEKLQTLHYLPNVIIEHLHWINNKSNIDSVYKDSLAIEGVSTDRYNEYKNRFFTQDINKLKSYAG